VTPEQYSRAQDLFEAVSTLEPEQRLARLRELCPDDPELRQLVLELATTEAKRLSAVDARIRGALLPAEGVDIGPYRLERLLGEGGMGEVWLARQQEPISRHVALKLVRAGMATRSVIARFEAERHALALMDHSAIAHVYDAGVTLAGLPFFAMEYVAGQPITEFCDSARLTLAQRLRLFLVVCEGVSHAHQKAVLHRDLKPSNVLVKEQGGRPCPKIIDFGIAKALTGAALPGRLETRFGALVGTPEYMSPERLRGLDEGADTRTDVYALGMILYELLAGALPIPPEVVSSGDRERVRRSITERAIPRPSALLAATEDAPGIAGLRQSEVTTLIDELKRDLDWIVMKAIAPEPAQRYATVSGLARDIQQYLEGRPVAARPPTRAYLASRFVRRHRFAVAASATGLLLLLLGAVGTTLGLLRAREAEAVAQREAEAAEQSLQFLVHLFEQSNALTAAGPNQTTRDLLGTGAEQLSAMSFVNPAVPARLKQAIGRSFWTVSDMESSRRLLEAALEEQRSLLGAEHPQTLRTMRYLAELYWSTGPMEEAERLAREAAVLDEKVFGPLDTETLEAMVVLVNVLNRRGRPEEALGVAEQLLERRERVSGSDAIETANARYELAAILYRLGRVEEAERLQRQSFDVRRRELGPRHLLTLQSEMALADIAAERGDFVTAERVFRATQEEARRQIGSGKPVFRMNQKLGDLYFRQARWPEAQREFEEALRGYRSILQEDHPDTLAVASRLGQTLAAQGRQPEAEPLLREACEGRRRQFGAENDWTQESCSALAGL